MNESKLIKIKYLINGVIALLIYNITPKLKKKKFWIVGGHLGKLYDDNSRAFFEYLIKEKKEQEVFWMLNKNSIAERENPYKDKILYRGSIKGYLCSFRCECVIVSHNFGDVIPIFYRLKERLGIKSIIINHGVYGFKKAKISDIGHYKYFDCITCVGEFERKIKSEYLKLSYDKLKCTGLARFDRLYNNRKSNGKIMVMFTWRNNVESCNYFERIKSFLTNKELIKVLKENNTDIRVILHSAIHQYHSFIKKISSENIIILDKSANIQNELIENSLLVTDYSSVAWDFAYMKKSVLFYQFDLESYLGERGSYLDLKTELFGDVAYEEEQLIKLIKQYLINGFESNDRETQDISSYYKYNDNNNCNRIYDEILKIVN